MVGHGHIKDPDGSTLMASDIVVNADTRIKYWGPNSCHNMVHKEMKEDQVDERTGGGGDDSDQTWWAARGGL